MKYRKKPIVIEATQWFKVGDHPLDGTSEGGGAIIWIVRHYMNPDNRDLCAICNKTMRTHGWIETLEGGHIVCPGDWIITGVEDEFYPCKPGIFEQTYEPVEEVPA